MNDRPLGDNPLTRPAVPDPYDASSDQLEEVVAEYMELRRRGDRTTPDDYARLYPHLHDELMDLLPTVDAVEDLSRNLHDTTTLHSGDIYRHSKLGDYRLVSEIARGGMGVIYEAEQESLGRRVAIKILLGPFVRRENDLKRFRREAAVAAGLHHTNIIPVFGVGEQDQAHYIVMQLIHGVGLDELFLRVRSIVLGQWGSDEPPPFTKRERLLRRISTSLLTMDWESTRGEESEGSPFEPEEGEWEASEIAEPIVVQWDHYFRNVARIGMQAASALAYAHRHHVLHRDIKPGNILVDVEGSTWIADFGLARSIDSDGITFSGDIVGTLGYMAPERFEGKIFASSDVFGLGIALYEMISQVRAFDGEDRISVMYRISQQDLDPPHRRNPNVPRDLETIILKAVARHPEDRYGDASELAEDLQRYLDGETIRAKRFSRIEMLSRWCRRNRLLATLAASVIVLLGTVVVLTSAGYFRETFLRQRAEATSLLAVSALDEIYNSFSGTTPGLGLATQFGEDDERSLLNPTALPISRDVSTVLENLLHFYDELAKNSDQSDELAIKSIYANRRVGDIHRQLGDLDKSGISYQRAATRIEQLPESVRDSRELVLEKARILNGRGMILSQQFRSPDARGMHENASRLLRGISDSPTAAFELASSLYLTERAEQAMWNPRRSARDRTRPIEESPDRLKEAIEILQRLLLENRTDPQHQLLMARCLLLSRDGVGQRGQQSEEQKQGLAMLEELVHGYPDVADFQYELAEAYVGLEWRRLSELRGRQADQEELRMAQKQLQRGLQMTSTLDSKNSQIPQFHAVMAQLYYHLGMVLEELGELADCELQLEKAIRRQLDLIRFANPQQSSQHELWLCSLESKSGQVLLEMGRLDDSEVRLRVCCDRLERLMGQTEIRYNRFAKRIAERTYSRTNGTLAEVLEKQGQEDEAEEIRRKIESSEM